MSAELHAARRFFRSDQAGCHVRFAIDVVGLEDIVGGVLRVEENRVVDGPKSLTGRVRVSPLPGDFVL